MSRRKACSGTIAVLTIAAVLTFGFAESSLAVPAARWMHLR